MSKCGSQGPKSVEGSQRDVMGYKEPAIPRWSPYGSMKPGIGGSVRRAGTQGGGGSTGDGAGGSVGLGGDREGQGTNRKG